MNKKYMEELLKNYKDAFKNAGLDIETIEDLQDLMVSYITSNMLYDFNIDININKLFKESE